MQRRLIVTWKNESSPSIIPVAELLVSQEGGPFEFGYVEGVREAQVFGFQPFLAFPDLSRRYESAVLFPFFANRILPTTRPDYLESLAAVGLDAATANVAEILGRTNGPRATDRIETILVPARGSTGLYVTHFLVRGVRYDDGEHVAAQLRPGVKLTLVLDRGNQKNPRARKLATSAGTLGYVADYLVADIDALESAGASPIVVVERVNPPPHPVHYRVLCRVECEWPPGFRPFTDERLAPFRVRAAA